MDEMINQRSEGFKAFLSALEDMLNLVEKTLSKNKPDLNGEKFMDNKEVCSTLHLSQRTLQDYRDKGKIPFIKLEGKILYKESDIMKILSENFFRH